MSRRLGLNEYWAIEWVKGGWISPFHLKGTRRSVIECFDNRSLGDDNYKSRRRRGEVRCRRVMIVPSEEGR